jgi:hypothetical protein
MPLNDGNNRKDLTVKIREQEFTHPLFKKGVRRERKSPFKKIDS